MKTPKHPPFESVSAFLDFIGRKAMMEVNHQQPQAMTRAAKVGVMPAHWFFATRDHMHKAHPGVPVPEHLFRHTHSRNPSLTASQNEKSEAIGQPAQKA